MGKGLETLALGEEWENFISHVLWLRNIYLMHLSEKLGYAAVTNGPQAPIILCVSCSIVGQLWLCSDIFLWGYKVMEQFWIRILPVIMSEREEIRLPLVSDTSFSFTLHWLEQVASPKPVLMGQSSVILPWEVAANIAENLPTANHSYEAGIAARIYKYEFKFS